MSNTAQSGLNVQQEKAALTQELRAGEEQFLAALANVPDELWRIAPCEGAWSMLDIVEHVTNAENALSERLQSAAVNDAPNPELDGRIMAAMLDRTNKRQSPDPAKPTGRYKSLAEALHAFHQQRQQTLAIIEKTAGELRSKKVSLRFGDVDGYQLLLSIALHPQRHAAQIEEIKNSPAYQAAVKEVAQ